MGLRKTTEVWDAILTILCRLTRMAHSVPTTRGATAETIASILIREVIRPHGVPSAIVSDRAPRFTSEVWHFMCTKLFIRLKMFTAYHPQTDGLGERTNQTIGQTLRRFYIGGQF